MLPISTSSFSRLGSKYLWPSSALRNVLLTVVGLLVVSGCENQPETRDALGDIEMPAMQDLTAIICEGPGSTDDPVFVAPGQAKGSELAFILKSACWHSTAPDDSKPQVNVGTIQRYEALQLDPDQLRIADMPVPVPNICEPEVYLSIDTDDACMLSDGSTGTIKTTHSCRLRQAMVDGDCVVTERTCIVVAHSDCS